AGTNYKKTISGHGTGLAPPSEKALAEVYLHEDDIADYGQPIVMRSGSRAAVDLSTSPYFPQVADQWDSGADAAFAVGYYAYGFLEAQDKGWTGASTGNPAHLLSPAWLYNMANGGGDYGASPIDVGLIIRDWGVPTLATMPYLPSDVISWGSPEAFREAPMHRAAGVVVINYTGIATVNTVKSLLNSSMPVVFSIDAYQFSNGSADGNWIISSFEYNGTSVNHVNCIVGYNDSISDDGDVGAFKVVSSWGSDFGEGGFYWITYSAFMEIGPLLGLTYIKDIPSYNPNMTAVWHYDNPPVRAGNITISIGPGPSGTLLMSKTPFFVPDVEGNEFPSFMCLDISEFRSIYNSSVYNFSGFFEGDIVSDSAGISSFKIELHDGGYIPAKATAISGGMSPPPPVGMPCTVNNTLVYYPPMSYRDAAEAPSLFFSSFGQALWVPVNHHSWDGIDCIQSGDVSDSAFSLLQASVDGPGNLSFYWRVSSEANFDYLSLELDGVPQARISGETSWQQYFLDIPSGSHTVSWKYTKDESFSRGEDAGWVDNIRYLPAPKGISVVVPNGGENWALGTNHNIEWIWWGGITSVNITLYRGNNPVLVIADNIPNTGSFLWSIPENLTPGSNYRIVISESSNSSIYDSSNNTFTLYRLVRPDAYEVDNNWTEAKEIVPGVVQNRTIHANGTDIDWAYFDLNETSNVIIRTYMLPGDTTSDTRLYVYNSSGVPSTYILYNDDVVSGNLSSRVDACLPPGRYYIMVDEYGRNNEIPTYFLELIIVTGYLTVVHPNGGEWLTRGKTYNITWFASSGTSLVNIDLYWNYTRMTRLVTGAPNTGRWQWNIPSDQEPGPYYRIKVSDSLDSSRFDYSDNFFTIERPLGDDFYEVDDTPMQARNIYPATPQLHTLNDGGTDVDWVVFTITTTMDVVLQTYGPAGDTVIALYNSTPDISPPIATDDDSGEGEFSKITFSSLPPGTYYLKVWEKGNDNEIPEYYIRFDAFSNTTTVEVIYPNGGEIFFTGNQINIRWITSSQMCLLDIALLLNNSIVETIATGYFSQNYGGNLTWTIPSSIASSQFYTIRIWVSGNYSNGDSSNSTFTIRNSSVVPYIRVLVPNGNETWMTGTLQNIRWTSSGVQYVNITLLRNGSYVMDIAVSYNATTGSFGWNIPTTLSPGGGYTIRITSTSNSTIYDISDYPFNITAPENQPPVAIIISILPNPSYYGQPVVFNGTGTDPDGSIIGYSWTSSIDGFLSSSATFTTPYLSPGNHTITLRVQDNNGTWSAPAYATIRVYPLSSIVVLYPTTANITFYRGETYTIRWHVENISFVNISLYRNGSFVFQIVAAFPAGAEGFLWTVPLNTSLFPDGIDYRIRISDTYNTSIYDESDVPFTIRSKPEIRVIAPNGNETWFVGTFNDILWSCTNTSYINISLYKNGVYIYTITPRASSASGVYAWNIPTFIVEGNDYKIRIQDYYDPSFFDESDAYFTIVGSSGNLPPQGRIISITPNPAQEGTPVTFVGNGTDPDGNVIFYYWTSNISGQLSTSRQFTISTLPAGLHNISLVVQDDLGAYSTPVYAELLILPAPPVGRIYVSFPNGGEILYHNSTYNIRWVAQNTSSLNISLWHNGAYYTTLFRNVPPETGNISWYVPSTIPASSSYTIRISDENSSSVYDFSNSTFTIMPQPVNQPPVATITTITPNPAVQGSAVLFEGTGADADGYIVQYQWASNISGFLSSASAFTISTLPPGLHNISFKVMDNNST
ncbi:MAG: Ser-Thr-rich GPI-anchored membrane family protein, partial [Thermoplasmata archaeon]